MNLRDVALMIPSEFRLDILDSNAIYKAIAIPTDPHMFMLFTIWETYVNPESGMDRNCTACLGKILNDFKTLQETFVELRREEQLLHL